MVSAVAVVARSGERAAEPLVNIPGVVPPELARAAGEGDDMPAQGFDSIESALEALSQGQMIVVLDDEKRENEGDLIMAADKVCAYDSSALLLWTCCAYIHFQQKRP